MHTFVHPMMRQSVILLFVFFASTSVAEKHFVLNKNVVTAREAIFKADYSEFDRAFAQLNQSDPDNLFLHYLKGSKLSLEALFNESGSEPFFERYYREQKRQIDAIKQRASSSKYTYWTLGELHFQLAMVQAKRENNIKAAGNVRSALIYLKKNQKKYPDFYGNVKTLALIKETILALPSSYQQWIRLIGIETGDLPGKKDLEDQLNSKGIPKEDSTYIKESHYYLAIMDYYLGSDPKKAWERVAEVTKGYKKDALAAFIRLNFAIKCKQTTEAMQCARACEKAKQGKVFPIINLMIAKVLIHNLEPDARPILTSYIKSNSDGRAEGKLYLYYLDRIQEKKDAESHLRFIVSMKNVKGEKGKSAQKSAAVYLKHPPELPLLKARLLYDGGHFQKALDVLGEKKERDYHSQSDKLEYNYRKGRIYEDLHREDLALLFYQEVLKKMQGSSQYYGSYAALYIAGIFERQGELEKAKAAYEITIEVCKSREYAKTVELKAKAGLKRLP